MTSNSEINIEVKQRLVQWLNWLTNYCSVTIYRESSVSWPVLKQFLLNETKITPKRPEIPEIKVGSIFCLLSFAISRRNTDPLTSATLRFMCPLQLKTQRKSAFISFCSNLGRLDVLGKKQIGLHTGPGLFDSNMECVWHRITIKWYDLASVYYIFCAVFNKEKAWRIIRNWAGCVQWYKRVTIFSQ